MRRTGWVSLLVGLALTPSASAQVPQVATTTTTASAALPQTTGAPSSLDKHDVDSWLDGFMPYALKAGDIAGAEVVIVKDGQILTSRGFGYADIAKRKPIDVDRTILRPGSISKLFTWTAVMQLVEQGKINLDRDVNDYLDYKIKPFHGQPVTMRELMTHSAGFEEKAKYLLTYDAKHALNTEQFIKAGQPRRIVAPMTVTAYSNYGASLAGYIVQRVSGERYEDYVQHHILTPLGMTHSTMEQPLPKQWIPDYSNGYVTASGIPGRFEIVNSIPAGALSATGIDMAHFMIAHLQNGAYGSARIMRPETAKFMHYTNAFTPIPGLPGMALGFYREDRNGLAIVGHAGDSNFFHSDLHLLLDKGVGFYITMNSGGRDGVAEGLRVELFRQFLDRYYPEARADPPTLTSAVHDAKLMAGTYLSSRRFTSNFLRMLYLIAPNSVTAYPNGEIGFSGFVNVAAAQKRWREVGPFQWQEVGGDGKLVATVKDGHVVRFMTDDYPPVFSFSPAPYWARGGTVLFLALGVLLVTVVVSAIAWIVRWTRGASLRLENREKLARRMTIIGALLDIACAAGFGLFIYRLSLDASVLDSQSDPLLRLLQILALLGFPAAMAACWNCFYAWRRPSRGWWSRGGSTATALASIAFVWFVIVLHVLTLGLNY
jgi:CubicO group peptidase (beta-lactamase class C family)